MSVAAFDSGGNRLWIGDVEAKMAIDTSGGGWRQRASAFYDGDGRRWPLAFDGDDRRQLWQRWTIDTA